VFHEDDVSRGTTSLAAPEGDRFVHGCDGPTRPVLLSPVVLGRSSGGSPLMTARTPVLRAYGAVRVARQSDCGALGCGGRVDG